MKSAISYRRVSTARQGRSGIGLKSQAIRISTFAQGSGYMLLGDYSDVQTGKGEDGLSKRLGLRSAVQEAKRTGCSIIVSDLSRLARNTVLVQRIADEIAPAMIICAAATPGGRAMALHELAADKQYEGEEISRLTKRALKALKDKGVKLGNRTNLEEAQALGVQARQKKAAEHAATIYPRIMKLYRAGFTSKLAVANELNRFGVPGRSGGKWTSDAVARVFTNLGKQEPTWKRTPTRAKPTKAELKASADPVHGSW